MTAKEGQTLDIPMTILIFHFCVKDNLINAIEKGNLQLSFIISFAGCSFFFPKNLDKVYL